MRKNAIISPCGRHRFRLERHWWDGHGSPAPCLFIGLNPSTADAENDDPTIRRCIRFAQDWGHTGLLMGNLYSFRATDPGALKNPANGPLVLQETDDHLRQMISWATRVVFAWGSTDGRLHMPRIKEIVALAPTAECLGFTAGGSPRHPLYVKASTRTVPFAAKEHPP